MSKSKRKGNGKLLAPGEVLDWHSMTYDQRIAFLRKIHEEVNVEPKVVQAIPYVPPPPCHTGNVLAFIDPETGVEVYGGGSNKQCMFYSDMIVIDLADNFPPDVEITGLHMPELIESFVDKRIKLSWRDYGIPRLDKEAWEVLVRELRSEVKRLGIKRILVCCVGGHGRTGTALSILAGLMGVVKTDPVEFIRKKYCKKAVESEGQLRYVKEVTGIEVNAKIERVVSGEWEKGKITKTGTWVSEQDYQRDLPVMEGF